MKPVEHAEAFEPTSMPVFGSFDRDMHGYYGLPNVGNGVKVAFDHFGESRSRQKPWTEGSLRMTSARSGDSSQS